MQKLIKQSHECRDLVDEAKKYHLRPECRHLLQTPRTKARYGMGEIMYVLGGFGNMQSPVDVVEKFDPKTGHWSHVQVCTELSIIMTHYCNFIVSSLSCIFIFIAVIIIMTYHYHPSSSGI